MDENCGKCGNQLQIIIESSDQNVIHYRAKCPFCHTDFSGVMFRNLPAPVVRLEDGDSSTR